MVFRTLNSYFRAILLCLIMHTLSAQILLPKRVVMEYPRNGVVLGNGWDQQIMDKAPTICVSFQEKKDTGQDQSAFITTVTDKFAMTRAYKIDTGFSFKLFGANVSDKLNYVGKSELKLENVTVALYAWVRNGARHASPGPTGLNLKPQYLQMARSDLPRFIKTCGTGFVSAIFGGAELASVFTFKEQSLNKQKEIGDSFEGSGFGAVINSISDSKFSQYTEGTNLKVTVHRSGGSGEPIASTRAEVLAALKTLASGAKSDARDFEFEVTSYESLAGWPRNRPLLRRENHQIIASQYLKFQALYEQVTLMLAQPGSFILGWGTNLDKLKQLEIALQGHVARLTATASKCAKTDCVIDPRDTVNDYEYRILLPGIRGSFEADVKLAEAIADLQTKQKGLQSQLEGARTHRSELNRRQLQVAAARTQVAVDEAQAVVDRLKGEYSGALRNAIVEKWIAMPSRQRCKADITDPGCLNSAQIDALAKRVWTFPPLPPTALSIKELTK